MTNIRCLTCRESAEGRQLQAEKEQQQQPGSLEESFLSSWQQQQQQQGGKETTGRQQQQQQQEGLQSRTGHSGRKSGTGTGKY